MIGTCGRFWMPCRPAVVATRRIRRRCKSLHPHAHVRILMQPSDFQTPNFVRRGRSRKFRDAKHWQGGHFSGPFRTGRSKIQRNRALLAKLPRENLPSIPPCFVGYFAGHRGRVCTAIRRRKRQSVERCQQQPVCRRGCQQMQPAPSWGGQQQQGPPTRHRFRCVAAARCCRRRRSDIAERARGLHPL